MKPFRRHTFDDESSSEESPEEEISDSYPAPEDQLSPPKGAVDRDKFMRLKEAGQRLLHEGRVSDGLECYQ